MRKIPDETFVRNAGNAGLDNRATKGLGANSTAGDCPRLLLYSSWHFYSFNSLFIYFLSAPSFAGVIFSIEMEARGAPCSERW